MISIHCKNSFMKKRLALNFKETIDSSLVIVGMRVHSSMNGNEYFPDPGMLIIELLELTNQFNSAMAEAALGDRAKISIKNDVRALLIKKLKKIGEFVQEHANGAETPLLSSGFPLIKPLDEIHLKDPRDFKILPGPNPGEIIMKVSGVKGARSYIYQWTPAPVTVDSIWETSYDTRSKKVITGLPLGVNYCFRMAAVGAHNQIIYTRVLSRYIS
jgi:hypothetical protein